MNPSVNYVSFKELCKDAKDLNLSIETHLQSLCKAGFDIYIKDEKVLEAHY